MDRYDVIIIGTGRGRRDAGLRAGALRQAHPPARARRLRAAGEGQLGPASGQRGGAVPDQGDLAATGTARSCTRTPTTASAGTPSSMARRCSACARRISASSGTTAASRRPGPSATTSSSRTTRRPSTSTRCTASAARTPPSRRPARPIRHPAVSHEPRIQQLSEDFAALGLTAVPRSAGRACWTRANRAPSPCIRCDTCDGFPCLVHAKSDARGALRRPGARASERHAADRRLRGAARDQRLRPRGDGGGGRSATDRDRALLRGHRGGLRGAINSAALLLRSANDRHPRGLANGSDVVGRHYMGHINSRADGAVAGARTRRCSRRRWR